MAFWEYSGQDSKLNNFFNNAMASDSRLVIVRVMIDKGKGVFEGLESLVDVGGGTYTESEAIAHAFLLI